MEPKRCLLLWLLLLLLHHHRPSMSSPILRYDCRPGTLKECKDAKFVPGHTLLGEGIDIVTMETTGSFLIDLQKVGRKCTVCENPHNGNRLQKLPTALVDWRPEASCSRDIQSLVSQSKVSVANDATSVVTNNWKVGLDVQVHVVNATVAVGGSNSNMAKFAHSKSLTDKYNFLSHKLECAFYSFGLGSNASLTPHFEKFLKDLPDRYDENSTAEYRRLIASFGTHYITRVKIGGRTQEVTAVRTCQMAMYGLKIDEVKDCLSVESKIGVSKMGKSASIDSKVEHCKKKLTKARFGGNFRQEFNERLWKVSGGNSTFDLLSDEKTTTNVFEKWMESLKTHPGLVSYSLDSIHNLVRTSGPKKENLRHAISEYIKEMALSMNCACPGHHVSSRGKDCSCTCPASKYTNSYCCPTHPGVAKVHVTIKDATGLKGDFFSKTDAYVKVKFDTAEIRTPTIWNNNKPKWNELFDLGVVELGSTKKYTIEVWDEDKGADDLLGKCEKVLSSRSTTETCYLNGGSVTYSVGVTCVTHLQGMFCEQYVPVPPRV